MSSGGMARMRISNSSSSSEDTGSEDWDGSTSSSSQTNYSSEEEYGGGIKDKSMIDHSKYGVRRLFFVALMVVMKSGVHPRMGSNEAGVVAALCLMHIWGRASMVRQLTEDLKVMTEYHTEWIRKLEHVHLGKKMARIWLQIAETLPYWDDMDDMVSYRYRAPNPDHKILQDAVMMYGAGPRALVVFAETICLAHGKDLKRTNARFCHTHKDIDLRILGSQTEHAYK